MFCCNGLRLADRNYLERFATGKVWRTAAKSKHISQQNLPGRIRGIGEKMGSKTNVLVEGHGVPLSIVVCGANRHDSVMLEPLLEDRFESLEDDLPFHLNLCLDALYVGRQAVVEAFHFWLKRFRKLSPRYEKTDKSYYALLHLAAGMIAFNKAIAIYV